MAICTLCGRVVKDETHDCGKTMEQILIEKGIITKENFKEV